MEFVKNFIDVCVLGERDPGIGIAEFDSHNIFGVSQEGTPVPSLKKFNQLVSFYAIGAINYTVVHVHRFEDSVFLVYEDAWVEVGWYISFVVKRGGEMGVPLARGLFESVYALF